MLVTSFKLDTHHDFFALIEDSVHLFNTLDCLDLNHEALNFLKGIWVET
jgi:hypothetical protein